MYLLYIDESDTTDKELGKLTPRWYCISGMNVVASSYGKTQREWEEFIKDQKLPDDFELKGEELYQGTGCWKGKAPQERIDFCKKVCEFINNSNVKIYSSLEVVKSNDHVESYKRLLDDILTKVAIYVSKANLRGRQFVLIFDQRTDIKNEIKQQIQIKRNEIIKKHKRSCAFVDYGFEGDSKLCFGIQIADFVSYFLRRQQIAQREANLFQHADNLLSIQAVDDIIKSTEKKRKVSYLSKRNLCN